VRDVVLWELFLWAGPVVRVSLTPGSDVRSAFVEFLTAASVSFACRLLTGVALYGRALRVVPAALGRGLAPPAAEVCVRNLSPAVDEPALLAVLGTCGPIAQLRLRSGSRGPLAFASYRSDADARLACHALDRLPLFGSRIDVAPSSRANEERGPRAPRPPHERVDACRDWAYMVVDELAVTTPALEGEESPPKRARPEAEIGELERSQSPPKRARPEAEMVELGRS
jgi:hypothetical protein